MKQITSNNSTAPITMRSSGISWPTDRSFFKNSANPEKQGIDLKDERTIVWFRVAGFSKFDKLWGIIDTDLNPGSYQLDIANSKSQINIQISISTVTELRSLSN